MLILWATAIRIIAATNTFQKRSSMPNITWLWGWKDSFCRDLEPYDRTGLARAIFLGDPKIIPYPVKQLFQQAGLSHIVAASGYNCVIVSIIFVFICRILLRASGRWNYRVYFIDIAAAIGSAWLFWLWSEQSPPITRAAIYITITGILKGVFIQVPLFRIVILQYLLSLILIPDLWKNASFQLTFFCLFSLFFAQHMQKKMRIRGIVKSYLFTNFCVCMGVLPVTWIFFGEFNFTGIFTNWLAVPPVTFLIMPLSLLAMGLSGLDWATNILEFRFWSHSMSYASYALGSLCEFYFQILKFWFSLIPHLRYAPYYQ